MGRGTATIAALACAAALALAAPPAASAHPWVARIRAAREWASHRATPVGFAVTDERGHVLGGYHLNTTYRSASVVKAMLMVCYLRRSDVRARSLRRWERDMLAPMIRRSDDSAANRAWGLVPTSCLRSLARSARMRGFTTNPVWGTTQITPAGTARLFWSIDRFVPPRHRAYAMRLLRTVVPSQRWGIATAVPPGFTVFFKGGFVGDVQNQGALLVKGRRRLAIAVLTHRNPSWSYGQATEAGIARILLRGYR
jgi:hypothetical protein